MFIQRIVKRLIDCKGMHGLKRIADPAAGTEQQLVELPGLLGHCGLPRFGQMLQDVAPPFERFSPLLHQKLLHSLEVGKLLEGLLVRRAWCVQDDIGYGPALLKADDQHVIERMTITGAG